MKSNYTEMIFMIIYNGIVEINLEKCNLDAEGYSSFLKIRHEGLMALNFLVLQKLKKCGKYLYHEK